MPRLDAHHHLVRRILEHDGWTITHDPLTIRYGGFRWQADLGAERNLAAVKGSDKIAVEIKVFGGRSFPDDLEKAVGQYGIYRTLLKRIEPDRELFLAVERVVWLVYFQRPAIQEIVADHAIKRLVFDVATEEIVEWIN